MSDVSVTISNTPIQVTVSTPGPAGSPGAAGTTVSNLISGVSISGGAGFTGNFNVLAGSNITLSQAGSSLTITAASTSADVSGLISSGNSDLRYLQTGASGYFYPWSNPNNFLRSGDVTEANTSGLATSGYVNQTSGSINERINNLNLTYLTTGASGSFYLASNPSSFITSSNLNGLGTTGSFDLRYLQTGVSGEFLKLSNLVGLINTGSVNTISGSLQQNLEFSGGYLFSIINSSSAGVSSLNTQSGILTLNGVGNVSVTTAGQTITVSGNTGFLAGYYINSNPLNFSSSGNVENTGTSLQNQVTSIKNGTGVFIQSSNLNGLISTGQSDIRYIQTGCSGEFIKNSNLNGLISSGGVDTKLNGLLSSGSHSLINSVTGISISGGLGITGTFNINAGANISLVQQGSNILQINTTIPQGFATSGGLESTGTALSNLIITERNKNTISGVSVSGGLSITGAFNVNAGSNITLTQAGSNSLTITAAAGGGTTTNGVTGINVTGITISGAITFLAGDGIEVIQSANTITISTPIAETGGSVLNGQLLIGASGDNSYLQGDLYASTGMYVISGSGSLGIAINNNVVITGKEQVFKTSIASGVDNAIITFPSAFISKPFIFNNLEISGNSPNSPVIYGYNISGITTSNYTVIFSETISESGVILHTLAKLV